MLPNYKLVKKRVILYRNFGNLISLEQGERYCLDGKDFSFPWYGLNSFITIDGPTYKHSVVHVLVCYTKQNIY